MNERICVNCGKTFTPHNYKQKFCCYECYLESTRAPKRMVTCLWCHTEFESNRPTIKFCSPECKTAYRSIYKRLMSLDSIRDLSEELETKGKDFRFSKPHEDLNKFYGLGDSS